MKYCVIKGCSNSAYSKKSKLNKHVALFSFPKNFALRNKWKDIICNFNSQTLEIKTHSTVCEEHFTQNDFYKIGLSALRLNNGSIPSVFPNSTNLSVSKEIIDSDVEANIISSEILMENESTARFSTKSTPNEMEAECSMRPNTSIINAQTTKILRYPGDITEEKLKDMPTSFLIKYIRTLKQKYNNQQKIIKRLKDQARYQKKRIICLKKLLTNLRKNNLISSNAEQVLQNISDDDIIKQIEKGKVKGKYPPKLRTFALTLHFYSPKAYNYVRQTYKNKLPASSTIRSWYSNINGSPGFSMESLEILKLKSQAAINQGKQLYGCLMMDEMAIRKQIQWDQSKKKFVGYIDYGTSISEPEELPLAKEALVYLINCVNERWKIPVAYFLVDSLTAEERAEITKTVLDFLVPSGITITAITFDGLFANVAMAENLGADILNNKSYFIHPSIPNQKIFIILDAAHMHKLIRNVFASKAILYDANDKEINWNFIIKLVELQEKGNFHLANKLTRKHIQWDKNKMNVRLSVQTLSKRVATALQQLEEDNVEDFVGCSATVEFITIINDVFDILNSRSLYSYGYKQPISPQTFNDIISFFEKAKLYLSKIKIKGSRKNTKKCILQTKSKMGFLGLINDMESFKTIYEEYVEHGKMNYIMTYKFSQDHLEIFFSCIRSMGGFNNNPNAIQFSAAYKRLLNHNEIKSSATANCIPLDTTNILTVSSRKVVINSNAINTDEIPMVTIPHSNINHIKGKEHAIIYMAGFVERKLLKQITCETCLYLIYECATVESTFIKKKKLWIFTLPTSRYIQSDHCCR